MFRLSCDRASEAASIPCFVGTSSMCTTVYCFSAALLFLLCIPGKKVGTLSYALKAVIAFRLPIDPTRKALQAFCYRPGAMLLMSSICPISRSKWWHPWAGRCIQALAAASLGRQVHSSTCSCILGQAGAFKHLQLEHFAKLRDNSRSCGEVSCTMFKQFKADWTVILGHRCATLLSRQMLDQLLLHCYYPLSQKTSPEIPPELTTEV